MIEFHLHGHLNDRHGGPFLLEADTPAECIRALGIQIPGFAQHVRDNNWHVVRGDKDEGISLDEEGVTVGVSNDQVHLMPAVEGAGGDGVFQTIIGVALIAASFIPSPYSPYLFKAGVAMTIGGVSQMLAPSVNSNYEDREKPDERPSFAFDGPVNTSTQGVAVPVGYGRVRVGSVVISSGISVEEMDA
ncbi:hypothetical protein [Chromohalobacter sp. 296-RDG]|uniref:hypothetical protein n=1 Tax=Chromohalobacter sp. 296-RDG TaxID=2994062 RepID=UPI0024688C18|nr:hypothetical protein [Chromohalobacter sp. 296-RDG]